jgi:GTP pyrophosphokinase
MDELFLTLHKAFENYIQKEENIMKIHDAYLVAKSHHEGQKRRSGEAYITHPVAVGIILAEMHAGPQTIAAALLHDVVEDTQFT